jgi:sugar phosphate isomerase/epimerase
MKLGFSSNAFKKYSLDQCIPLISRIGYSAVEILCDVPHAYPPQHQDVVGIRTLLSRHNLEVSNLNTFTLYAIQDTYHPSWIDEATEMRQIRLQHTINCIELASKLGCKNISTEAGGPFYEATNDKTVLIRRFMKEINVLSRFAEEHEVKVLLEPEPGLLLETSKDFSSFIKRVKSDYIRLNFDIAHFYCTREDPAEALYRLSDFIEHIHLSDIANNRIHNHLIPGQGSINFKAVFKALNDLGYSGVVTVELYPYQEDPMSAATKSYDFLQRIQAEIDS